MTAEEWKSIKFFKSAEFDSPDAPDSGRFMDHAFVRILDAIRTECGFPLHVLSGYRTEEHNLIVGGVDSSAHTKGFAADIALLGRTSGEITRRRYAIVRAALLSGIFRIGIGETFIHLDTDPDLPKPRMWTY